MIFLSYKKSIPIYLSGLFIFIIGSLLLFSYSIQNHNHPINVGSNALTCWLQEQERQIWDHVYSTTHISKQECERLKEEYYEKYKRYEAELHITETSKKPLSRKTRIIVRRIIQDFGVCPEEIALLSWNTDSFAAATDTALFINEDRFAPLPLCVQKFLIGHELQHFLHKDTSTRFIFDTLYKPSDTLRKNHPLLKLIRFYEIRADVQSALQSSECLHGYHAFTEMISLQGENEGFTHPKNSVRLALAHKLVNNASI